MGQGQGVDKTVLKELKGTPWLKISPNPMTKAALDFAKNCMPCH